MQTNTPRYIQVATLSLVKLYCKKTVFSAMPVALVVTAQRFTRVKIA